VGFVDTLGAKAFRDDELFMNAIAFMVDVHERISAMAKATGSVRTTYFSDNIGASVELQGLSPTEQKDAVCRLLRLLAGIQYYYLSEFGILCRGGVAIGNCFHSDSMVFGPALVDAYLLESAADAPRIVVTNDVVDIAGDDVIQLYSAAPLKNPSRSEYANLRSIDFLDAEIPGGSARAGCIEHLESVVAEVLSTLPSDSSSRMKWQWTADRLSELKDG
jgi:hypothetical protein